jgi:hypothetical protein
LFCPDHSSSGRGGADATRKTDAGPPPARGAFHTSANLPLVIEIIDTEDEIKAFMPMLDQMMTSGLATLEKVRLL